MLFFYYLKIKKVLFFCPYPYDGNRKGTRPMEQRFDTAVCVVCDRLRLLLNQIPQRMKEQAHEIRMRVHGPLTLVLADTILFVNENGPPSLRLGEDTVKITKEDLLETFAKLCDYSVYTYQNEIKNGYITYRGGHRVGICGTAVTDGETIANLRDISSMNVRIARQIYGASSELIQKLGNRLGEGLLLAGPPACGKTTLLRDICRQISQGVLKNRRKVAVVDERGELAATYCGEPQNDLGPCCDVLDGYPKGEGILQAIRCLSPSVVVCDEIGSREEIEAVQQGINAGVSLIASIHAGSLEQLLQRPQGKALLETGAFPWVAMMDNTGKFGTVTGIFKAGDLLDQISGDSSPSHNVGNRRLYRVL